MKRVSRRELLGRGALLLAAQPLLAGAAGPADLRIAHLKIGSRWNERPTGLRRLLWEVGQRTSIEAELEPAELEPSDRRIFAYPFLYWSGSEATPPLSEETLRLLRRHLTYGGTLLVDASGAEPGGVFDVSVRRELSRVLPRAELERIPNEHVVYKTFYLVDHQAGRVLRVPYLEGVFLEKRLAVVYCQNDLGGAWARDAFGRWEYEVTPGGERQREMAFRLGINVVMYAMCLDYKDDLVHLPFITKRRR